MFLLLIAAKQRLLRVRRKIRRMRSRADITEAITELNQMKHEVQQLVADDTSWVSNSVLVELFNAEVQEATRHFVERRYRLAMKCRSSARATRICIKLNMRAHIEHPDIRPVVN